MCSCFASLSSSSLGLRQWQLWLIFCSGLPVSRLASPWIRCCQEWSQKIYHRYLKMQQSIGYILQYNCLFQFKHSVIYGNAQVADVPWGNCVSVQNFRQGRLFVSKRYESTYRQYWVVINDYWFYRFTCLMFLIFMFSDAIVCQAECVICMPVATVTSTDDANNLETSDTTDDSSQQPSAKWQWTSLFASYRRNTPTGVLSLQSASVGALVSSYMDAIKNCRICNWTDVKTAGFGRLEKLLEKIFCVTATSAPVERIFSHGGLFMRPHRARLGDRVLCELVMLKCNNYLA